MFGLFLGRGFEPLVGFKVKDNYGVAFRLLLRGKVLSFCIFVAYVGLLWVVHDLVHFWSLLDRKEMKKGQGSYSRTDGIYHPSPCSLLREI